MHNDIEELINENLSLRKYYQIHKSKVENLQKELQKQKERYQELNDNYINALDQNTKLTDKIKSLQAYLNNNNASFVSQIEELKSLIEQKENQMQNFQLKMIPSLDQDMIRVKLIAEMEGPYQQIVDKKDRQINRLKDQNHQLRRQKQIAEFALANKQKDFKKQEEELKNFYDQEIDRLTRQLTHFNQKTTTGKTEKDIIKSYRQEIDQLRSSCQFHRSTEEELRKELGTLRLERQRLLADLMNVNAQKAIQMRQASNDGGLKELKFAKAKLEDQLQSSQREIEKLKSKLKMLEQQKNRTLQKYEWDMKDKTAQWQQQRQKHRNQINQFKDEIRKLKQLNHRSDQQCAQLTEKLQATSRSEQKLSQEVSNLKIKLNMQESQQTSRYRRSEEVDKTTREKIERQTIQRVTRQLRIKIRQEIQEEGKKGNTRVEFDKIYKLISEKVDKQTFENFMKQLRRKIREEIQAQGERHGESPRRQAERGGNKSDQEKIRVLQEKIKKLTQKLEFANSKILQLLKDKAKRSDRQSIELAQTRTYSYSPEHDYHNILLENRDCSFVPMCPPVIVEHLHAKHGYYENY